MVDLVFSRCRPNRPIRKDPTQDYVLGHSQPELSKLARKWRSGRCNLLSAWRRPGTRKIELVAVAVVPSIHLGTRGGGWTARRELFGGEGAQQVPVRLRSGQALGYAPTARRGRRDDKVEGGGAPLAWLDVDGQSRKKPNLDSSDSQPSPSTGSGQALRDWSRYTVMVDLVFSR
jgi:hypothetical protein